MAEYCDGVMSGRIVAGRLVKLAVARQLADLKQAGKRGFYFDEETAATSIAFVETCCRHSKGEWAGEPVILSPWQKFIVWVLLGWRRKSDRMRRFQKALIEVARKNGKSTLCSTLALLLLLFDNPVEAGAEIFVAATKKKQAHIIFDEAKNMCGKSPSLGSRVAVTKGAITAVGTGGFIQPLGADAHGTDGLNPHAVFKDELHAWRDFYRDYDEKLTTGSGARRQPLFVTVTTAGDDKSTLWKEEHEFAVKVLEALERGEIVSDTVFAFLATIDAEKVDCPKCKGPSCKRCDGEGKIAGDDPFAEGLTEDEVLTMLAKANPGLGISVKPGYLLDAFHEAQHKSTARNKFLRYHANTRVESIEKAISAAVWAGCGGRLSPLKGERCHGAFDIGRSDDFAGITLLFPFQDDDDGSVFYEMLSWSFTVADRTDELRSDQFDRWVDQGKLILQPGDQLDYSAFEDRIVELAGEYDVGSWAFDPSFAQQLGQRLEKEHGLQVFPFFQTAKNYNEPIRKFLAALRKREICHGDDPLLAWQAGNLCIRRNNRDEWMPEKITSPGKIDGMVAALMAFSECLYHADQGGGSVRTFDD